MAQAEAEMRARKAVIAAPAADYPIAYWYENINYNRQSSGGFTTIYGGAPCDAAGYRLNVESWWQGRLSSILGGSSCDTAHITNRAENDAEDFSILFGGEGAWLGRFSDNVGHMQVHA